MRWSNLYAPTLRDSPAGAEAVSHRLLLRGGFVRQVAAGHYSLLPLGVRVRAKVIEIVRQELDAIGGQEFVLPAMQPAEIWKQSGRWSLMCREMFQIDDRKGAQFALAMTDEEMFTDLARDLMTYRELPQLWYQFQMKFRDEPRPKGGLIRLREFTMQDSYSFHADVSGLAETFDKHQAAYQRAFARMGLDVLCVQASSGCMGGRQSTEMISLSPAGEDVVVHCSACGYAANIEAATSLPDPLGHSDQSAPIAPFPAPASPPITEPPPLHGIDAARWIKTIAYVIDGRFSLVLIRGDRKLSEPKLREQTAAREIRVAEPDEIAANLGFRSVNAGPVGVRGVPILSDVALRGRRDLVSGANEQGVYLRGIDMERDVVVDSWVDIREVESGESCPACRAPLELSRGIEVAHIFKLGQTYTEALGVHVADTRGQRVCPVMGSYGMGIERAMAAIVEANYDSKGIVWPFEVAPFAVVVTVLDGKGGLVLPFAERLYDSLKADGIDALLDDRIMRAGAKFADADLIGIPIRITVGARSLAEGNVEVQSRARGDSTLVPVADAARFVKALLDESCASLTLSRW